jgi:hypothetical protein
MGAFNEHILLAAMLLLLTCPRKAQPLVNLDKGARSYDTPVISPTGSAACKVARKRYACKHTAAKP